LHLKGYVFSGEGLIYDDQRSRLASELAEALLVIRCNFPLIGDTNYVFT